MRIQLLLLAFAACSASACMVVADGPSAIAPISESEVATLPEIPANVDVPQIPDDLRTLVVGVRTHLVTPPSNESPARVAAICRAMSIGFARSLGFTVAEEGSPHDATLDFACTGTVKFASSDTVMAILPGDAAGPTVSIVENGVAVASLTRKRVPMRCPPTEGSVDERMQACGHLYGHMAEGEIARWLGASPELHELARSKRHVVGAGE